MTPDKLSLSKDKIRVLLLEGINDSAVTLMRAAGYTNLTRLPKAPKPASEVGRHIMIILI